MKKITAIFLLFSFLVFSGFGCKTKQVEYNTSLEMWGVFDDTHEYSKVIDAYQTAHPFVTGISYRKFADEETYKKELLNYLAAGTGPDIFMIHNTWLPEFQDKIVPAPNYLINEVEFRDNFVDVVADDFFVNYQAYGVPLSVDSLALYYNKDIFNAAGIVEPPKTWLELDEIVKQLTQIDRYGNIKQSAIALGTYENINRATDILSVMMMQLGATMSDRNSGEAAFNKPITVGGEARTPGKDALEYYTAFADASQPIYTWNTKRDYSIDEFYEGDTAMMINYSWHYDTIKAKNAKLNFGVAELPQFYTDRIGDQVNYANYWVWVVAKNKDEKITSDGLLITDQMRILESWQFLKALTFPTAEGMVIYNALSQQPMLLQFPYDLTEEYLKTENKPAARRDLVERQKVDVKLRPFVNGNLIAQSWYQRNSKDVEKILGNMIESVYYGEMSISKALKISANRISQLMQN
jgi:multiple sugar transport system substrate-binding protein